MLTLSLALLACTSDPEPQPRQPPQSVVVTDPGRVGMRRLNGREYDRTVHALLGTRLTPSQSFPADGTAYGFDTVAEALTTSPLLIEAWDRAAQDLAAELVGQSSDATFRIEGEGPGPEWTAGERFEDRAWQLSAGGVLSIDQSIPAPGTWELGVIAWADTEAPLTITVDGVVVGVPVVRTPEPAVALPVWTELAAGHHEVTLTAGDAVVWIDAVTLRQVSAQPSATWEALDCDAVDCVDDVLAELLPVAWRRPVSADERAPFVALVEAGVAADLPLPEAFGLAAQAMLLSPDFLYRLELDPVPDAVEARPLTDWELAARLSYFLWSAPPDAELRALATTSDLREALPQTVHRMLQDDRSEALIDGLLVPWLALDRLPWAAPVPELYPDWSEPLRDSLAAELRLFAGEIVLRDRSLLDLLTSRQTWVDDRLADHYGWPRPGAGGFAPVVGDRVGLLGKGAIAAALAHPDRSAPVQRGAWVLSALLCAPTPPPPPDVPNFAVRDAEGSVREQLEAHRTAPACAGCHAQIDPLGFPLEHLGPDGATRLVDVLGEPIDTTSELLDGTLVDSADSLAALLAADPDVPACMVEQVFTYALGRAPRAEDAASIDRITAAFVASDHRFEALVLALTTDPVFTERVPWTD